jgi:hypothetical protein
MMKHWIIVSLITVLVPIALVRNPGGQGGSLALPIAHASDSKSDAALGVEQLMIDVDNYRGEVRVEGVVSSIAPAKQMLSLIDTREFKECGITTCARFTLPVHWTGSMPSVEDTVRINGTVKELEGKLVFEAKGLEKVISQ